MEGAAMLGKDTVYCLYPCDTANACGDSYCPQPMAWIASLVGAQNNLASIARWLNQESSSPSTTMKLP
jgi:hypothetical protein